jgi:ABC-type multidrug transport system ATPase subunit
METLIEELSLEPVANQLVRTLSLGYCRRSGLARALLADPDLLLLDEPWNGLDQESSEALTDLLRRYRAAGNTAIVVAHSPSYAVGLFDAVLRLARGVRIAFEAGGAP